MTGETAPALLRQGRIAEVANYCMADVSKTCRLFTLALAGIPIQRCRGPVTLRHPTV